jgi:hypothetical protein
MKDSAPKSPPKERRGDLGKWSCSNFDYKLEVGDKEEKTN